MTFPPPMEEDEERFVDFDRVGAAVVVLRLREDWRDDDERTGGAGGPPVSLTWSLRDGDDVVLATEVVVVDVVVSALSPVSQKSITMMAMHTTPNMLATIA